MEPKTIEKYMTPISEVCQNVPVCDSCYDNAMYADNTLFYCRSCAEKRIYRDLIREACVILEEATELLSGRSC